MNAEQRQVAVLWSLAKLMDLRHRTACRLLGNYIHHCHFIITVLSPKHDNHFTIPQRAEGGVDLDGWLHTQTVYLPASSHPCK